LRKKVITRRNKTKNILSIGNQFILLLCFLSILLMQNCTTVKQYADSEVGKMAIETAKEKAKDKETQEKVKEFIKEKNK
jgi:hypothetical protein